MTLDITRAFRDKGFWCAQYAYAVLAESRNHLGFWDRRYYRKHADSLRQFVFPRIQQAIEDNASIRIAGEDIARIIRECRSFGMHKTG